MPQTTRASSAVERNAEEVTFAISETAKYNDNDKNNFAWLSIRSAGAFQEFYCKQNAPDIVTDPVIVSFSCILNKLTWR